MERFKDIVAKGILISFALTVVLGLAYQACHEPIVIPIVLTVGAIGLAISWAAGIVTRG